MPRGKEAIAMRDVGGTPQAVYDVFSRIEDFPRWFDHLASVRRTGPRTSEWTLKGTPPVVWQVETTQDRRGQIFAWASTAGGLVTYGAAEFEAARPGRTRVRFRRYNMAPSGSRGAADATASVATPQRKLEADLERFVQVLNARSGPLKPVQAGNFILGAPPPRPATAAPPPGPSRSAAAPSPAKKPAPGGVTFQRLGTTRPPPSTGRP